MPLARPSDPGRGTAASAACLRAVFVLAAAYTRINANGFRCNLDAVLEGVGDVATVGAPDLSGCEAGPDLVRGDRTTGWSPTPEQCLEWYSMRGCRCRFESLPAQESGAWLRWAVEATSAGSARRASAIAQGGSNTGSTTHRDAHEHSVARIGVGDYTNGKEPPSSDSESPRRLVTAT